MKIKLVIFDLDGTLLDTLESLGSCVNELLIQEGYQTHELVRYKTFIGNGILKLIERALEGEQVTTETIHDLKERMLVNYDAKVLEKVVPYEGVVELLKDLQEKNIKLAVVTNKPHAQAVKLVTHYLGEISFVAVRGNEPHIPHKPDPFVVQQLMKAEGVLKEEVLYVGDSDVDMQTAQRAGVCGIGVTWGFRSPEELLAHGAQAVIKTPQELLAWTD